MRPCSKTYHYFLLTAKEDSCFEKHFCCVQKLFKAIAWKKILFNFRAQTHPPVTDYVDVVCQWPDLPRSRNSLDKALEPLVLSRTTSGVWTLNTAVRHQSVATFWHHVPWSPPPPPALRCRPKYLTPSVQLDPTIAVNNDLGDGGDGGSVDRTALGQPRSFRHRDIASSCIGRHTTEVVLDLGHTQSVCRYVHTYIHTYSWWAWNNPLFDIFFSYPVKPYSA